MPAGSQSEKRIVRSLAKGMAFLVGWASAHQRAWLKPTLQDLTAEFLQQLTSNDELLHLSSPLINAQRTNLAIQPLHRLLADDTEPAPQLHRRVDHLLLTL